MDQGPENAGSAMTHLQNRLRLKFLKISAKNSQGNSVLERKHGAINNGIMSMLLQNLDERTNWQQCLEMITFSANTTTDKNGCSPARLSFGHQPKFLADVKAKSLGAPDVVQLDERIQGLEKIRLLCATLKEDHELAKKIRRNEKLAVQDSFNVGDLVWLHRKDDGSQNAVSEKCQVNETGPVTIVSESMKGNTHIVLDIATGHENDVHAEHLYLHGAFRELPPLQEVSPDNVSDNISHGHDGSSSSSDSMHEEGERGKVRERELWSGKRRMTQKNFASAKSV
eukprot:jgi/Bigna1/145314/aug1.97_g20022